MMDITIKELHREKVTSETLTKGTSSGRATTLLSSGLEKVPLPVYYAKQSQEPSSDRPKCWTICPFCLVRYKSYITLLNKPTRCQSCYLKFLANEPPVKGAMPANKTREPTLSTMEKSSLSQNHIRSNLITSVTPKNQLQPQKPPPQTVPLGFCPRFCAMCPFCEYKYRFLRKRINKWLNCLNCKKKFHAVEVKFSSIQQNKFPSKNPGTDFSGKESSPGLSCAVIIGEKKKRNEYDESCTTQNHSKSKDVIGWGLRSNITRFRNNGWGNQIQIVDLSEDTSPDVINTNEKWNKNQDALGSPGNLRVNFSSLQQINLPKKNPGKHFLGKKSATDLSCAVVKVGEKRKRENGEICNTESHSVEHNNGRESNDNADEREEYGSGKQVHEVDWSKEVLPNAINMMDTKQDAQAEASLWNAGNLAKCHLGTHFSGTESCMLDLSCCAVKVGVERKQNEYGESCNTVDCSNSEDDIVNLSKDGDVGEESGIRKQFHEVDLGKDTSPYAMNRSGQLNRIQAAQMGAAVRIPQNHEADKNSGYCDTGSEVATQPKISECFGFKFNNFDKLRKESNFAVGQVWALYDAADGMPRVYAHIRKVSAPSFGLRITYLEPNPDDEKEIQWFEEELPVSVGKFRHGKNQNTKDRSLFSHVIWCNEGNNRGDFIVFPRKGETWALFKNWDINWSSEPDSHRKYEYEIVEILSDYADEAGVSVAFLHKAKGYASVFFRMGTGDADIAQIPRSSLYRFSHRIRSFKMTGIEAKGMPKDAYELDQAVLPALLEDIVVPLHLLADPKPEALYFPRKGKVFQTGQIWSFYSGNDNLPLYYCRIQKITFTQAFEQEEVFKLHVSRLKASPFPEDVIQWEDKKMPVGCGTFFVRKSSEILMTDDVSHQIVPQISMLGNEYTILPKIGEVWATYRSWSSHKEYKDIGNCNYDIVEVLDDTLEEYKVLALEHVLCLNDEEGKKTVFRAAESRHPECDDEDGSEVMFSIPKSKMLRFSHQIPASRVIKEVEGDLKEVFEVVSRTLPTNVRLQDH